MSKTVFIDGGAGTTGLEIADRLESRDVFDVLVLGEDRRKDPEARRDAFANADFAILCLPDEAAREAVSLAEGTEVRIIDASSAHRVADGWIFGFPELVGRDSVVQATRVSNPGCYSSGFIALIAPLVKAGLLPADWPYSCNAVSGYSGGGKALIARFEDDRDIAWRGYGLQLDHKHVPEMQVLCGLSHRPLFSPAVIPAHRGMAVDVPLPLSAIPGAADADTLRAELTRFYEGSRIVRVCDASESELLLRKSMQPSDRLDLYVLPSGDGSQVRLLALSDNLGKGASGAAVQNLNLMAGIDEAEGLRL